jgi:hypothetical protein
MYLTVMKIISIAIKLQDPCPELFVREDDLKEPELVHVMPIVSHGPNCW